MCLKFRRVGFSLRDGGRTVEMKLKQNRNKTAFDVSVSAKTFHNCFSAFRFRSVFYSGRATFQIKMVKTFSYVLCKYHKNVFQCFLFVHVFIFLEICKIKPVCLGNIALLPSFIALFSCDLLHWVVILHGWYCGVILLWSRHRGYTNSINNSNGTVLQKLTDSDRPC